VGRESFSVEDIQMLIVAAPSGRCEHATPSPLAQPASNNRDSPLDQIHYAVAACA